MRRRYPESGPERREREEWQNRSYGAGKHELKKCRKCDEPFTEREVEEGLNVMNRSVGGGQHDGAVTIPIRVSDDDGGYCERCRLRMRIETLEEAERDRSRSDAVQREKNKITNQTCPRCHTAYTWKGSQGYACRCWSQY